MSANSPLVNVAKCAALALMTLAGKASGQVASGGDRPPTTLAVRYAYTGFYGEGDNESGTCPGSRRNGTLVVEGNLQYARGMPPGAVIYQGRGRIAANVDHCGFKPIDGIDGSAGRGVIVDSDYCNMTIVMSHDVDISLAVEGGLLDNEPRELVIRWEASKPVGDATVTGNCLASMIAFYRRELIAGVYQNRLQVSPYDEALNVMAAGGIPRAGVYESTSYPTDQGRWTLSLNAGPVDDMRIAIEGPSCGCIKAEEAESKPLRFTATASAKGGTFGTFAVRSAGKAPRVIANTGGTAPRADLAGSRQTGATTLAIVYTKDGKRYTVEHAVSFCVMDSVTMTDGYDDITFDDSDPGRAKLRVSSKAWLDGTEISSELAWTLEAMKGGTELSPGEATGAAVTLGYTNLSRENPAFGPKKVTVRAKSGRCDCERERSPRIFFRALATNHPSADDSEQKDAANFFFYWMQTAAAKGINTPFYRYRKQLPNVNQAGGTATVAARFVSNEDRIYIAEATLTAPCRGPAAPGTRTAGPGNSGIDCFAENLRHEWQHRVDLKTWWPDGYPDPSVGGAWDLVSSLPAALLVDNDGDKVPTSLELKLPGCSIVSKQSCAARPFDDVLDLEIYAYYAGWKWQRGSADKEDWSCNGKQWKGGPCDKE